MFIGSTRLFSTRLAASCSEIVASSPSASNRANCVFAALDWGSASKRDPAYSRQEAIIASAYLIIGVSIGADRDPLFGTISVIYSISYAVNWRGHVSTPIHNQASRPTTPSWNRSMVACATSVSTHTGSCRSPTPGPRSRRGVASTTRAGLAHRLAGLRRTNMLLQRPSGPPNERRMLTFKLEENAGDPQRWTATGRVWDIDGSIPVPARSFSSMRRFPAQGPVSQSGCLRC